MIKSKKQTELFKIVLTALLIALNVILERFLGINATYTMISLGFVAIAFASVYLGIFYAVIVAVIGDIIGAFFIGGYFFGFTITNCVYAIIISICLKKTNTIKIAIGVTLTKVFCTIFLNSIWFSWLKTKGFKILFLEMATRIPQAIILLLVETVVLIFLFTPKSAVRKVLDKEIKKII